MKPYDVYFEIFGKKMKTTVSAGTEALAKKAVRNKIKFHRVVAAADGERNIGGDMFDLLNDIVTGKNK